MSKEELEKLIKTQNRKLRQQSKECTKAIHRVETLVKENAELEKRISVLLSKIKHLTEHLEPQTMKALFEQVEEEVRQEQRIKKLEEQVSAMSKALVLNTSDGDKEKLAKAIEVIKALRDDYYAVAKKSGLWKQSEQFLKEVE